MTASFSRLQLATRIHFALLRTLGEGVDVSRMLRQRAYADEVIEICRSLIDPRLMDLADRFDDQTAAEDARAHMAHAALEARAALAQIPRRNPTAAQPMGWTAVTSGFGVTRAMADLALEPTPPRERHSASGWFAAHHHPHH